MSKKVSIIIPTYKSRGGLRRSVESALSQSYDNIEIVVVDDNLSDSKWRTETELIMAEYANNPKVSYIRHETNKNGAAARNTGIRNSSGDYVAFLDDDDEFMYDKVEKQVKYLEDHKEKDAVYTLLYMNGKKEPTIRYEGNALMPLMLLRSKMYTSSLMFTRKSIERINGFDESFRRHQDYELMAKFFSNGFLVGLVRERLTKINSMGGNILGTGEYERLKKNFLDTFSTVIEGLESTEKGSKSKIYAANYAAVCYSLLADKEIKLFRSFYKKYSNIDRVCFWSTIVFFAFESAVRRIRPVVI